MGSSGVMTVEASPAFQGIELSPVEAP